MIRNFGYRALLGLTLLALFSAPAAAVTLRLVAQLDTAALNAGVPGSVAAYGNTVYIGTLFGGARLHQIANPLTTPTNVATFGGINDPLTNGGLASAGGTSNGYVSLNTDGVTLVAATDNGGGTPDIAQAYTFGTSTLLWGGNAGPGSLNTQTGRIDGAAVEPVTGRVMTTGFGGDAQNFYAAATGAPVAVPGANILFYPGVGTGWKDVDYDKATGDLYLRSVGGVARGKRVGDGQFQTLEGGAGVQTIVDGVNNSASAINVAFLPTAFAGQELVILNIRAGVNLFDAKVRAFSATPPSAGGTATDTPVPLSFVLSDGVTPFTTASAASGIYDFSYDPVNNLLYVSDFSSSQVHIFTAVPEPGTLVLVSGAAFAVIAYRRRKLNR
jgi:hypothetical protein